MVEDSQPQTDTQVTRQSYKLLKFTVNNKTKIN